MHFRLAPESGYAEPKGAPVDSDGLAEGIIAFKDGAESKRKNGGIAEAVTHDASVFDCGFLVKLSGCVVVFADNYGEFTTGIAENRSSIDSLNALQQERAASAGSIWEGLMLGKTVSVPRHVELSEPG
jgi:hypothetical protein